MKIPQDVIDRVNDLDVVKIFESEGIETKRSGALRSAVCPFHPDKGPSLKISVAKNSWHCYGCGAGRSVIDFIMRRRGFNFAESVKYLADNNGIKYEQHEETEEEQEARFKHEQQLKCLNEAQEFFASQLSAPIARDYLKERGWDIDTERGAEIIADFGLGYAPGKNVLLKYMLSKGYDIRILEDVGLIARNEDTNEAYDAFRQRIMFPIYSRSGNIVGYSGRDVTGTSPAKYVNTRETDLFRKGDNLFGYSQALRRISVESKVVLVEGNPDVIRLHEIGVDYAVAPLGTALTDKQVELIAKRARTVILLGDRDKANANSDSKQLPGDIAVAEHGEALIKAGLAVQVMELPQPDPSVKVDADDYFKIRRNKSEFDHLLANSTTDFITWYADRKLEDGKKMTPEQRAEQIAGIAQLLSWIKDEGAAEIYLDQLITTYKNGKTWKAAFSKAKGERERETKHANGTEEMEEKYGFFEHKKSYCCTRAGNINTWSNFVMHPVIHIRDERNAKRIFEIENNAGDAGVIKLQQSELVSLSDFKTRVETAGNYIFEAGQGELTTLKKYWYAHTESADEIRQLGWQKQFGFYAWGNGGFDDLDNFVKADKYGIIDISGKKYYVPGSAADTASNTGGYMAQRRFQYKETNDVTLKRYAEMLINVFGDNAKVGLCFLIASCFHDVISDVTTGFPILNLFGPKGTGKSELGHALTSFFTSQGKPANISSVTKAALAETVAEYSNAVVHLEEYRTDCDLEKQEFLKGLWDGTGRSRINMDNKKDREMTAVDCGVIMSGQQMANADPALFSRVIYLTFHRAEFSDEEKKRFEELQTITKRGLQHLTRQILKQRQRFVAGFRMSWDGTLEDLNAATRKSFVEDRTLRNWAIPLAAFRCIESFIELPFTYQDMLLVCMKGCLLQNTTIKHNNELAVFWDTVNSFVSSNSCWIGAHYKITIGGKPMTLRGHQGNFEPIPTKRYLFLNFAPVLDLYINEMKRSGRKGLPKESMKSYLSNSESESAFIGIKQNQRFTIVDKNGNFDSNNRKTQNCQAMVFDYDMIEEKYGISLEISYVTGPTDEERENEPILSFDTMASNDMPYEEMD